MNEHLFTTDIEGRKRLKVLDQFETDLTLPKHQVVTPRADSTVSGGFVTVQTGTNNVFLNNQLAVMSGSSWQSTYGVPSLWSRFKGLFTRAKTTAVDFYLDQTSLSVIRLFESLMGAGKQLENLKGRLADYQTSIQYATKMGQTALAEQLTTRLPVIEVESVLVEAGFRQFIEEATLIDFARRCEKGLKLDYVKNFTRLIPHGAQVNKLKLDELKTFDAYVILHFDPANKATALTKREIAKKKDPILFGILKGSPRLYHVFSWKDEFCDLTFPDLIAKYGKDVLTLK